LRLLRLPAALMPVEGLDGLRASHALARHHGTASSKERRLVDAPATMPR
jgi:hypothetical protein